MVEPEQDYPDWRRGLDKDRAALLRDQQRLEQDRERLYGTSPATELRKQIDTLKKELSAMTEKLSVTPEAMRNAERNHELAVLKHQQVRLEMFGVFCCIIGIAAMVCVTIILCTYIIYK